MELNKIGSISFAFLTACASDSSDKINNNGERGSPCLVDPDILKGLEHTSPVIATAEGSEYIVLIIPIKLDPKPNH